MSNSTGDNPYRAPSADMCDHGIRFDDKVAESMDVAEIRKRWPRLNGPCPLGCGYVGIYYASRAHYVYGDW